MKHRLILSSIAMLMLASSPLAAQAPTVASFAVKKCDEPKVPIGMLRTAAGTVTFRLAKVGKPDTTSLAVVKVLGLSVAGFKSAVPWQLSACRFEMGSVAVPSPMTVTVPA